MHIKIQDENFNAESLAVIAILAAEGEPETVSLDPLRGEMRDFCRRVVVNENFRGEAGKLLVVPKISAARRASCSSCRSRTRLCAGPS